MSTDTKAAAKAAKTVTGTVVSSPAGMVTLPAHPALWAGFRVHGMP